MNKYLAALAAAIGLLGSGFTPASAGVVISETETISGQDALLSQHPRQRTIVIDGNKKKVSITGGHTYIIDLDSGTLRIIDHEHKGYVETAFPPRNMMVQVVTDLSLRAADYTRSGTSRTIAGFKCDDYKGAGSFDTGEFTVVSCVSNEAPGASEFSHFRNAMVAKLKEAQVAVSADLPDGIPMAQETTTKVNPAKMPAQTSEKVKKQLAKRPPVVTKTEVTKVEVQKIAASEFAIPHGFARHHAGELFDRVYTAEILKPPPAKQ
jgi:hypothetical protein